MKRKPFHFLLDDDERALIDNAKAPDQSTADFIRTAALKDARRNARKTPPRADKEPS